MPCMFVSMKASGILCDAFAQKETAVSDSAYLLLDFHRTVQFFEQTKPRPQGMIIIIGLL